MLQIPDHITEAEILALIEGDMASVPPERREIVREAVAKDPVLSRVVGEIKADATAVVSFSRIAAPPAIRARVIEDLRRPVALPERIREPVGGEIPVSSVIVTTESPWRTIAQRVPVRRFAAAASIMLAAGLGVWLVGKAISIGVDHARSTAVATATEPEGAPADTDTPPQVDPFGNTSATALASNAAEPAEGAASTTTDDHGIPGELHAPPAQLASDEPAPEPAPNMELADAIDLARAGRLVIRVLAVSDSDAQHDIDQFAVRTSDELRWRPLEAWELPQVTMALRERAPQAIAYASERPPAPIRAAAAPDPSKVAAALPPVEPIGVAADIADALKQADFRPLYTVEMDESERDLETLLHRLSKSKSRVAEFVALEEPLPTLIPSTDPAAVLWWSRPPSGWTRRLCIPIVLETRP